MQSGARGVDSTVRTGLTVVAIAAALLLAFELGLRAFGVARPDPVRPQSDVAYRYDADYLVALKPNLQKTAPRFVKNDRGEIRTESVPWETNSVGFRGRELKPNPDFRIMVYGDSNVQAAFSTLQNTFPARLENYLSKVVADTDIDVVNAGVVGFGPDQSLLKMSREIDAYRPNLIVFHVFADNDLGDLIRNRLFDLDSHNNLVATTFKREVDGELLKLTGNAPWSLASIRILRAADAASDRIFHNTTRTARTAQEFINVIRPMNDSAYAVYRRSQPKKFSHFSDYYDIDVAVDPDSESSRTKLALMEAVLKEAQKVTSARNVALLVVIEPSTVDLATNYIVTYKDLAAYPGYRRDNLSRAIDAICERLSIERLNLFGPFMANTPEDLYFPGNDNHWNDRGQDLAAQLSAQRIASYIAQDDSKTAWR